MNMTHYMELLSVNQPWNLLLFMAIPTILVETIAITELYLLLTRRFKGWVRAINRAAGILAGFYFVGIFLYLLFQVALPLTLGGGWRSSIDVIAVGSYLLGVVPLLGITLLELGVIERHHKAAQKLKTHAMLIAVFLVITHIAMIFGMLDPALL